MSMKFMVLVNQCKFDNPLKKLIFLQLADNADENGECFPSHQYIADISGCGHSTVRKHITLLKEQGYLSVTNRVRDGAYRSNVYRIIKSKLSENMAKETKKPPTKKSAVGMPPDSIPMPPRSIGGMPPDSTPPSSDSRGGMPPDSDITSHLLEPVKEPRVVFEYWKEKLKQKDAVMDDNRQAAITWALENYSLELCKQAIDGCAASAWHIENGHIGIELIFKASEKTERFINKAPKEMNGSSEFPDWDFVKAELDKRLKKKAFQFTTTTSEAIWRACCGDWNAKRIDQTQDGFMGAAKSTYQSYADNR